jgi:hypothetical protein
MGEQPVPRTFYRNVHGPDPPLDDFTSDKARGEPEPFDPVRASLYDGISVFNLEQQARRKARAYPSQGDHIARLELPDGAPVSFERTLSTNGHFTLRGDPEYLRSRVVSIVPV